MRQRNINAQNACREAMNSPVVNNWFRSVFYDSVRYP
jgi:hypothetical protein